MARTDKFREQHKELLALAGELEKLLDVRALTADGRPARSTLGRLMGKLVLHLGVEDQVLYPELTRSKDARVADMARRFAKEMESTSKAVVAYSQKWSSGPLISEKPDDFVRETRAVLRTLGDRIRRENEQLYAAADRQAEPTPA
ncbi:MAG: hemerythrin domain-containing protein [Rubrivivax sp.]|nr:hemerythrin domain-containing protein [Rubrivivax sp.]MCL4696846.1 hemerythrin domain-containing protein [Burkholderiaceae bacterium]